MLKHCVLMFIDHAGKSPLDPWLMYGLPLLLMFHVTKNGLCFRTLYILSLTSAQLSTRT